MEYRQCMCGDAETSRSEERRVVITLINIFDIIGNFDTDINEFILINKESTPITEDFHEDLFGVTFVMIPGFNINKRYTELLWLKCTILCHCK